MVVMVLGIIFVGRSQHVISVFLTLGVVFWSCVYRRLGVISSR